MKGKRFDILEPIKQSLKKSADVLRSFFQLKYIDQLFLIPITIWSMAESAFTVAQFTRVSQSLFNQMNS